MKKKATKHPAPSCRIVTHTVGSGLTTSEKVSIDFKGSGNPLEGAFTLIDDFFRQDFSFDGRIAAAEKWAIRVLEDAGLPTDPGGYFGIPDGLPLPWDRPAERIPGRTGAGDLLSFVEAKGKKERADKEWYAAKILSRARLLRGSMERIQTNQEAARKETNALARYAFDLGLLVYEAIGFKFPYEPHALRGMASLRGSKSPKPPRRCIAMEKHIRTRRQDPDLTFEQFWEELKTYRDGIADPLVIGNAEASYRNGEIEIFEPRKKTKMLQKSTILRYWEAAKPRTK